MTEDVLGPRFDELTARVLAPLVLGGEIVPVRPFGAKLGLEIGRGRSISDEDLRSRLDLVRVRRARVIAPVDTLAALDEGDWALCAALNDLLQVTNHELTSGLTRKRHARLLASVCELCERIAAPRDLAGALARHATFGRVLELSRTDTLVRWWTGSASFRGQPPAQRLLRWKDLRRVRLEHRSVLLSEMCAGLSGVSADEFCDALGLWLTRSPLTDLATATRQRPVFGWSASTLSIIATVPGRTIAWRLLSRQAGAGVVAVLVRAAQELPETFAEASNLANAIATEVSDGLMLRASS